ncbi:MAG: sulfatase-like hydrolase/transferase [Candidatus Hydrogenedentes bacterium]|nr:sulfatase-like hydrolase/transferase [Candidatus Hydrogenedentota bacterium]
MSKVSRRGFVRSTVASGVSAALASCTSTTRTAKSRPNLVVVFADDHAHRALGYNNPAVKTPHMDRIAGEGVILDRCYIASPICVASRASMMSGLFPQQHGSVGLDASGFQRCVVEEKRYKTFAHHLTASGYATAFFGKSHLGDPKLYGFSEAAVSGNVVDTDSFENAKAYLASRETNDAPFLLWLAPNQPHVPLVPEQRWLDLYDPRTLKVDPNFMESPPDGSIYNQGKPGERYYRDTAYTKHYKNLPSGPPRTKEQIIDFIHAYYATISHLDNQLGGFFDQLRASRHYENTTFIYLADNGYHLGNHGLGNKITMHEEAVRVPMFAHGYGVRSGTRSTSLVSSLDIYPTLLDLAGIEAPAHLMGKSIRSVLASPRKTVRDYVSSECVGVGGKVGEGHRMVRSKDWKYVLTDSNEEALFDETKDPYEMHNVIGDPANTNTVRQHRDEMRVWQRATSDTHAPPPAA